LGHFPLCAAFFGQGEIKNSTKSCNQTKLGSEFVHAVASLCNPIFTWLRKTIFAAMKLFKTAEIKDKEDTNC